MEQSVSEHSVVFVGAGVWAVERWTERRCTPSTPRSKCYVTRQFSLLPNHFPSSSQSRCSAVGLVIRLRWKLGCLIPSSVHTGPRAHPVVFIQALGPTQQCSYRPQGPPSLCLLLAVMKRKHETSSVIVSYRYVLKGELYSGADGLLKGSTVHSNNTWPRF